MRNTRRILLVHAHPDDESLTCGATMARYVAEGAAVTLVTCTLGEEGEILVPSLAEIGPDGADQLGGYRIVELERACAALGVTDHRFLGAAGHFRDSGMMGVPSNTAPRAFWGTPLDVAARLLADIVEEVRPSVVVTYDERGGYGHPDHIQAHRVTMRAVELAAWPVAKVYWTAVPQSVRDAGLATVRDGGSPFTVPKDPDSLGFAVPDDVVTTRIEGVLEAKRAAMQAHATQITVDGEFYALSNDLGQPLLGVEHFRLVAGERGPGRGEHNWEDDLFAGLD
ncbi:MAG TPA: N-acetyl-1-D-myo-inositol-2-amino-2-deoxy-alpha-D-glucopyranoside deacetylase [Mycobacteriales bacterium]|nr:N-acetyl-1-D-myo-inositol-2-amino-2-deoxy-alpha-D-glucopyranoside deacetylase [Mycobacteriales bacterium]